MLTALLLAAPAAAHKPKPHHKHSKHAKTVHTAKLVARTNFSGKAVGKLTAVSSSVTVRGDDREATCSVGDTSPKVGDFNVGDRVKIACANGVLTAIAKLDVPVEAVTALGTLAARSDASVTVTTENGDATCKRADPTPTLGDVRVGDKVELACVNGVLTAIATLDAPPVPPPVPPTVTTGGVGTITALAAGGIAVHTDGADVTCRLTGDSRVPVEYHVGDFVRVSCTNGLLTAIARLDVKTITSGVLTALVDGNLTVLGDGGERSCKRGDASPSTDAFHVGDHVRMTCVNGTLTTLEHL